MKSYLWLLLNSLLALVVVVGFVSISLASEFSAEMTGNQMGQDVKAKIYVKGDKIRMEGTSPAGELSIAIMDVKQGTLYTLIPDEKMYIEMSGFAAKSKMSQFESEEEIAKIADKKHIGTEEVNGYLCDKYEIIYHDKSKGTMTQWYSKKLNYPIKMVYRGQYGEMISEYKNIKEGGISDSLFEIPSDYTKMTMPGMAGMGMNAPSDYSDSQDY